MDERIINFPPLPSEQTPEQKFRADKVLEEIGVLGTVEEYDGEIIRFELLMVKILRQEDTPEEHKELILLEKQFDDTFGRYGAFSILEAYESHSIQ